MSIFKRWRNKKHLNLIDQMPCCICGGVSIHHHIIGVGEGVVGDKAADSKAIPLCFTHHTGDKGIHVLGVETWEKKYGKQTNHLLDTLIRLKERE